ncbi:MAG: hypothetical protein H6895_14235 [Defluviimonas sp.]|uniref:hypothetical protein n=1 Tax=Albidovulum sp. TaxID=1872424 RepID=UPI002A30A2D1|nr:hypothetical protein [Defluviimonas sp.]
MTRLFFIIYTLAGTTLAGSAIIAVLSMNMFDLRSILIAAAAGALVALPVAWIVARRISAG